MNRENKRREYEKGYYKKHPCLDSFTRRVCGKFSSNRIAADDNPMKHMAIAMRPYGSETISRINVRNMTISMETGGK